MSKRENISMSVIRRLPRYYRYLSDLLRNGTMRISSRELASRMGLTASQIRQDLNCFGGFGQQGYGYEVEYLYNEIGRILGVRGGHPAILVGCGNLGNAVASYMLDSAKAFRLIAAFDSSAEKIGSSIHGVPVLDASTLSDYCRQNTPSVAILCLPNSSARQVVDTLYEAGIRYFWNFSHYDVTMSYPDAVVENVHITDSMLTLCYKITSANSAEEQNGEQTQV